MGRVLVVTGMHRSATSLVASLLGRAGLALGKHLLPADARNPRGFFEDADIQAFHERALERRALGVLARPDFDFQPSAQEAEEARSLLRERQGQDQWGWKDPRTSLFLPFWNELLPEARFLFLYRHPLEVLWSLLRRGEPLADPMEGVEGWLTYDEHLLRFHRQASGRSLLVHSYQVLDDPGRFAELLSSRLGLALPLDEEARDLLYHPQELKRIALTPAVEEAFRLLAPRAAALYAELEAAADLPAPPARPDAAELDTGRLQPWLAAARPPAVDRALLSALMGQLDGEAVVSSLRSTRAHLDDLRAGRAWFREQEGNARREAEALAVQLQQASAVRRAEQEAWDAERQRWGRERADWQAERGTWDGERGAWEGERATWEGERAAWGAERAAWGNERSAWDGERQGWDAERAAWDAERAAWDGERAAWEGERRAREGERRNWAAERQDWAAERQAWAAERQDWQRARTSWEAERAAEAREHAALAASLERERDQLAGTLAAIEGSLAFRIARLAWRLRRAVAPTGSLRGRLAARLLRPFKA